MSTDAIKAVVRAFYAALDERHAAAVDHHGAPSLAVHLAGRGTLDRDGFRAAITGLYAAFPDLRHGIDALIAEGDLVAARITETGTHQGLFQGIAPTGASVSMAVQAIHRIAHGKVAEIWLVADTASRLQQLSLPPIA